MTVAARLNPLEWFWRVYYGYDFFISYAHQDARAYAETLHQELAASGFRCFLDSAELQAGERLTGSLTRTLRRSQVLVVLHSPAADRSDWVAQEVALFAPTRRRIIAIDLRGGADGATEDSGRAPSALQRALADRIYVPDTAGAAPSEATLRQVRHSFAGVRIQSRRVGVLSAAVVVLLVIAALATLFAVLAEERRKVAVSRQLALASRAAAEERQDVALLLAALAYRTADTFAARDSLLQAILYRRRLLGFLRTQSATIQSGSRGGGGGAIGDVAFGRAGKHVWVTTADKKVLAWNAATRASISARALLEDGRPVGGRPTISPADGSVARSLERAVVVVAPDSGAEMFRLDHDFGEGKLAFSADGATLALGTEDGVILVWDVTGPQPAPLQLTGSNRTPARPGVISVVHPVVVLEVSPDGRFVLAEDTADWTARIWDLAPLRAGEPRAPVALQLDGGRVAQVAFHPDGDMLIARLGDGTLRKFDVRTGQPMGEAFGQTRSEMRSPVDLAFHPGGRWLATGSRDGTVSLWDLRHRQPGHFPLSGHRGAVTGLAFGPDGARLVTGSDDGSVMIWDTRHLDALDNPGQDSVAAVSRVSGSAFVDSLVFAPDGAFLAGAAEDAAVLWDARSGQVVARLALDRVAIRGLAVSPDGGTLASGGAGERLVFWDIASRRPLGEPVRTRPRRGDALNRLAFTPDGRNLVVGTSGGGIFVFDSAAREQQGEPLREAESDPREITQLSFTPDGRLLAVGSASIATLWDFDKRAPLDPPLQDAPSRAVALSPDGRTLAASSVDGIVLWDIEARARIGQLEISSVELAFEDDKTTSLAFSPDGGLLAAGREDGRIQLWDAATRQALGPPLRPGRGGRGSQSPSGTPSLAFRADGKVLAAGGFGLSLWDVDPPSWADLARRMANRDLSDDELARFLGDR